MRAVGLGLAACALLAGAPAADAARVATGDDGVAVFSAQPGERNDVRVSGDAAALVIADVGAPVAAGRGCAAVGSHTVRCASRRGAVRMALGDGNDRARGGSGDDRIGGGTGDDLLNGGEGDDRLDGGPGRDEVFGSRGADVLLGGPGADLLDLYTDRGACQAGADVVLLARLRLQPADCEYATAGLLRGVVGRPRLRGRTLSVYVSDLSRDGQPCSGSLELRVGARRVAFTNFTIPPFGRQVLRIPVTAAQARLFAGAAPVVVDVSAIFEGDIILPGSWRVA